MSGWHATLTATDADKQPIGRPDTAGQSMRPTLTRAGPFNCHRVSTNLPQTSFCRLCYRRKILAPASVRGVDLALIRAKSCPLVLMPEVGGFDARVFGELGGFAVQDDLAGLEHVSVVGEL